MIFISHKKEDSDKAAQLRRYLDSLQVPCYLDVLDPSLVKAEDITEYLVGKINNCTHVVAVITEKTRISWWVPFELGAAYQANKGIGAYVFDNIGTQSLPDYLLTFPIMRTSWDLDKYLDAYRGQRALLEKSATRFDSKAPYAATFVREVKSKLGQ